MTTIVSAACHFLDELERFNHSEELPVPYIMKRIRDILRRKMILKNYEPKSYATPTEKLNHKPTIDNQESTTIANFRKAIRTIEWMDGSIYIDTQFLNSSQGYIIKEISLRCPGSPAASILVRPPTEAHSTDASGCNRYCIEKIHGITWESGDIDILHLQSILSNLFNSGRTFVLKGPNKVDVLERLGLCKSRIESIDEHPNLQSLRERYPSPGCPYHRALYQDFACAQKHTYALMCHHQGGKL